MNLIKTNKQDLAERCAERLYDLEDVMACVVDKDGDEWTIDVDNEAYPRSMKPGVGSELKTILKVFGITSTPTCSCNARARTMNKEGIEWCKSNRNLICDWLKEEADRRGLPYFRFAARKILNMAITRAEKKASKK